MPRWGMAIDLDRCTGCRACEVACKSENNVPIADPDKSRQGRAIAWMKVLSETVEDHADGARSRYLPRPCMHCDNPPCTKVCPVGATQLAADGIVGQIYARCIGCRYCANACPYTVKSFNWSTPTWPESLKRSLNPDVSIRPKGVIEKCTFCHHRLQIAKDRARADRRQLTEKDFQPACADSCPTRAIVFGDLDNPNHRVSRLAKDARATTLLPDLGTKPKVFYLREEA